MSPTLPATVFEWRRSYTRSAWLLFAILVGAFAASCSREIPFDRARWRAQHEPDILDRDRMVTDLVTTFRLKSLDRNSVIALLGEPNAFANAPAHELWYLIKAHYSGFGVDPDATVYLVIRLDSSTNHVLECGIASFSKRGQPECTYRAM
jgi:hypothetical protein